jgi:hypothetical protein
VSVKIAIPPSSFFAHLEDVSTLIDGFMTMAIILSPRSHKGPEGINQNWEMPRSIDGFHYSWRCFVREMICVRSQGVDENHYFILEITCGNDSSRF